MLRLGRGRRKRAAYAVPRWRPTLPYQSESIRWSLDLRYSPAGQPTGRPAFPEFLARSRAHPEHVLRDPDAWAALWYAARDLLAGVESGPFNRWHTAAAAAACA